MVFPETIWTQFGGMFFLDCLEKVYLVRKYGFNGKQVLHLAHIDVGSFRG